LRILVTFAVEPEFAGWRKSRNFAATALGRTMVYGARISAAEVDVVLTGMGPANARRAAESVMTTAYAACISSGFAGALKAEHEVGEVLIAETVGEAREMNGIPSDRTLLRDAAIGQNVKVVQRFLTTERVARSPEEKARLAEFGDAVEMESYAILSVAVAHNVPAIAIRVISDRFDQVIPMDFSGSIDQCGHVLKGKLARDLLSDPRKIPALIRLGRQSSVASEHLIGFLESYIERLSMPGGDENPLGLEKVAQS
jgi:adenosylhomocysteine nucleosidase